MQNKVRNRLLGTIMAFVAVTMLLAFIAIYVAFRTWIYTENTEKLHRMETVVVSSDFLLDLDGQLTSESTKVRRLSPTAGVYFNLIANKKGDLLYVDSAIDLNTSYYQQAKDIALQAPKGGYADFANRHWQYVTGDGIFVFDESDEQAQADYTYIRFLDISDYLHSTQTLLISLVGIYILLLFVIFLLARHFANRSVKPMAVAWNKQKQFVAGASYELQTPLNTLRTNLDIMSACPEKTIQEQMKWLDNSKVVLNRLSVLLGNMLELSQVEVEIEKPSTTWVDIEKTLEEALLPFVPDAEAKRLKIMKNIQPELSIRTNETMLRRVLEILLDNAVKYTGEEGQISICANIRNKHMLLKIKNFGPGIATEDLDRIFDRFYRGNKMHSNGDNSYGLGLPLAQELVDRLGGSIRVESSSGLTSFKLRLPEKY